MHCPATDPAAAVQSAVAAVLPTAAEVQPTAAADFCPRLTHLHGLCGVLTWMQQDTLPLVAYAYVALIHESMHAGLLMHACMLDCFCPCLRVECVHQPSMARLFLVSIPVLFVLQHCLVCYIKKHFLLNALISVRSLMPGLTAALPMGGGLCS
jgi:hypothetical protein